MIGGDSGAIRAGKAFVEILADDLGLKAGLDRASARMRSWAATTSKIGLGLIAAGGALVGPLLLAGKQAASFGDELNDITSRTGLSVDAITALTHAADLNGSSFEAVETSVRKMQVAIAAAAKGNAQAAGAFDAIGLSVTDLLGLSPDEQLGKIADALLTIEDPGLRAAAAVKILGKAGTGLLPMLAGGSEGLRAMNDEAMRLGLTTAARAAAAVGDVDDSISSLTSQIGAFKTVIGAAVDQSIRPLLTYLQPVLASWIEWADANRGLVTTLLLVGTGLIAVGGAMVVAGVSANVLLGAFGNLLLIGGKVGPLLLSMLTSPLSLIRGMAGAIGSLASTFVGFGGSLVSTLFGVASGGAGAIASFVGGAASSMLSLIAVISSGVAGLAIDGVLAIAAVVPGLVSLILDGAITIAAVVFPIIAEAVGGVLLGLGAMGSAFALFSLGAIAFVGLLAAAWYGSLAVWSAITGAANSAGSYVSSVASAAASAIGNAFTAVKGWAVSAFGGVVSAVSSGASSLMSFLAGIPSAAAGAFTTLMGYGEQSLAYLGGLFDVLKGTALAAWGGIVAAFGSGDFALAGQIAISGFKLAWAELQSYLGLSWTSFKTFFITTANAAWSGAQKGWAIALDAITGGWATGVKFMSDIWGGFKSLVRDGWNAIIDPITTGLLRAQSLLPGGPSYAELKGQYDHDRKAEDQQSGQDDIAGAAARQAGYDADQAARKKALQDKLDAINKEAAAQSSAGAAASQAEHDRLAAERDKARKELADLVAQAKSGAGLGGIADADNAIANRGKRRPAFNPDDLMGAKEQFETRGQYGAGFGTQALNVPAFSKMQEAAERTADATERTADAVEQMDGGGMDVS